MSIPTYTRPFNIDQAIAGAPISLACGWPVSIVKYDMRDGKCPILGLYGEQDQIGRWTASGVFLGGGHSSLALVMTPLGYVDGKPAFVGDKVEVNCLANDGDWKPCVLESTWAGTWNDDGKWFRWPAPPKVYPECRMGWLDLVESALRTNSSPMQYTGSQVQTIANTAIRHFIDNLTVLPDDCALRAKLVEMGWTEPDTSANWLERMTPDNAKEGAR